MRVMSGGDLGLLYLRECAADASQPHFLHGEDLGMCARSLYRIGDVS